MKNIFLVIFLMATPLFATTTDVCILKSQDATPDPGTWAKGYCLTAEELTQRQQYQSYFYSSCSDRKDNIKVLWEKIEWTAGSVSHCATPQSQFYVWNYVNIDEPEQAEADIMAQLYSRGYVLFDHQTMIRTH